jgi:maltose O-acetyltransferase
MLQTIRSILSHLREIKKRKYIAGLVRKGLLVGEGTEILEPFFIDPDHCFLISIGANCTLAPNVRLIAHDASTKQYLDFTRVGKISIRDNCFIGDSVIILPNVTVGPNSIVGAGAVVTRDVPENSIAVGNPARIIGALDDYLAKTREKAHAGRIYGAEYLIEVITPEAVTEMQEALSGKDGYIT